MTSILLATLPHPLLANYSKWSSGVDAVHAFFFLLQKQWKKCYFLHLPNDSFVQSREDDPYIFFSEGFGKVGQFVEGLVVDDLRVAKTENESRCVISAVFVDGFDDFIDMLVKIEEAYWACIGGEVPMKRYMTYYRYSISEGMS